MGANNSTHLSEEAYRAEVNEIGAILADIAEEAISDGGYSDYETAVLEHANEVVFPHEWFEKYGADPADLGAIIGYGSADPERFGDVDRVYGRASFEESLRKMAGLQFEVGCIENALEREG